MTSEQRRLHYLQAMAIDGYYPRYQLSGAAESVACEHIFDEEFLFLVDSIVLEDPLAAPSSGLTLETNIKQAQNFSAQKEAVAVKETNDHGVKERSKISGDLAQDLVNAKTRRDKLKEKPTSTDKANNDISSHSKAINFNLGVWRISDELIVVDTRQPNSALPTEKLLLNIVKALGYSLTQLPRVTQLRWPSVKEVSYHDDDSARDMVEAFLTAENTKKPFSKILLMGNNAAKYVLPKKDKKEDSDSTVNPFNFNALVSHTFELNTAEINAEAVVVPSLTMLLQKPRFKAITWQSIQSLRV